MKTFVAVVLAITMLTVGAYLGPGSAAASGSTIDFEGLAEGAIVSSVSSGSGISGDALSGSATVSGLNPAFGGGTNAAMIFDGTCTSGCSGGDDDLEFPDQGNILIISEDLDSSDPDDADLDGMQIDIDLSGLGSGTFFVKSLVVLDIDGAEGETSGTIEIFDGGPGGTLVTTVALPNTGDNGKATVAIGDTGDFIRVNLDGSGAIDDIMIEPEELIQDWRMTGGGSVFKMDDVRVTRGFEIHCDLSEPNNLEVNWLGGNKFHLTELTSAICTDDPDIDQDPPPGTPFDTFDGEGTGRLNGVDGATIQFVFVDAGEPAAKPSGPCSCVDTAEIIITDASGAVVLTVSGNITFGNLQAHG